MAKFLSTLFILLFISGCSTLRDLASLQKPTLTYSNMSVQSINFNEAELLFNFDVNNPNPLGITANGYSYDFLVNSNSFLSGNQDKNVKIGSGSTSILQVPVTLQYSELLNTFRSLLGNDEFNYGLNTEFVFDIPGLGQQRLPANISGSLPLPKIPRIEFSGFDVSIKSPTRADLELKISIDNPNRFPILLNSASYVLNVNGKEWLNTTYTEAVRVTADDRSEIVFPVQLNAVQMGSTLIDLLRGRDYELDYSLRGNMNVGAEIEGYSFTDSISFDTNDILRR
jgi:LEA14-like dessication related protein